MKKFLLPLTIMVSVISNSANASSYDKNIVNSQVISLVEPTLKYLIPIISQDDSSITRGYSYHQVIMAQVSASCFDSLQSRDANATNWYHNMVNSDNVTLIAPEQNLPSNSIEVSNSFMSAAYVPIDNFEGEFCGVAILKQTQKIDESSANFWAFTLAFNDSIWSDELKYLKGLVSLNKSN